jgi:hypothetical protein
MARTNGYAYRITADIRSFAPTEETARSAADRPEEVTREREGSGVGGSPRCGA